MTDTSDSTMSDVSGPISDADSNSEGHPSEEDSMNEDNTVKVITITDGASSFQISRPSGD